MNKKLSKLFYRGMWHRKKEVAGVCIATMLASFFITCILLFQENMYQFYEIRKLVCNAKRWRAIQYLER